MSALTTRAAIARASRIGWEIVDLALDPPKAHEVRVKIMAAGLCHSDDHITQGDAPVCGTVPLRIDYQDIPWEVLCLTGCGVPTGWGVRGVRGPGAGGRRPRTDGKNIRGVIIHEHHAADSS